MVAEPGGVADGVPVPVVVEVGVDVDALGSPRSIRSATGPSRRPPYATVVGLPQRMRAVEAQVRPVGGQPPGVVGEQVVQAQRGAVGFEHRVDVLVEPRRVAELHGPADRPGRHREEPVEPLPRPAPSGAAAGEVGTAVRAEALDALEVAGQPGAGSRSFLRCEPNWPTLLA